VPLSGGATIRTLLVRGMLAGVAAGLAAFVFAYLFGEPGVNGGIGFEEQGAHSHGGEELVSRGVQSTVGLLVGVLVYAVAVGGILALVYAATRGRIGPARPRVAALTLAAVGFVAVVLVPFLKYPANPPGSSDDGSIGQRTGLYLVMLLFSLLVAALATALGQSLAARLGTWNAVVVAAAAYVLVAAVGAALLPTVDETPADFPATVLYDFRIAALGVQAVLWTVLGLTFGAFVERGARRDQPVTARRE
jgi:predicted cobalt transporter CbtA